MSSASEMNIAKRLQSLKLLKKLITCLDRVNGQCHVLIFTVLSRFSAFMAHCCKKSVRQALNLDTLDRRIFHYLLVNIENWQLCLHILTKNICYFVPHVSCSEVFRFTRLAQNQCIVILFQLLLIEQDTDILVLH